MERAIQIFAAIHFFVIGWSHILAPRAWAEFFVRLRERGPAGVLVVGFMSLGFGSIVAAFHPVWTGIPLALTLVGWAQVVKAFVYFCFPAWGLERLKLVSVERSRLFVYPGLALVVLASLLVYHLATHPA